MKKIKFSVLEISDTFYIVGDYGRIEQYEKISESYGVEVLTNSSKWFEDDVEIYID